MEYEKNENKNTKKNENKNTKKMKIKIRNK